MSRDRNTKVKRSTAKKIVDEMIEAAKLLNNSNEQNLYKIDELVIFGSYINSDRDLLGDLDIGIVLKRKKTNEEYTRRQELDDNSLKLYQKPFAQCTITEMQHVSFYPFKTVINRLFGKRKTVSIHDLSMKEERGICLKDKHKFIIKESEILV